MSDKRNVRLLQLADQIRGWSADLVTQAVEHIHRELAIADGYPDHTSTAQEPSITLASTPSICRCKGQGCDSCAPSKYTATERAAESRYRWKGELEDYRDAVDAFIAQHQHIVSEGRRILGQRAARIEGTRCSGTVDATCTNLASEHRHPDTGQADDTLCDQCWVNACPTCRRRAPESKRGGKCEACYRRELRSGKAAA